MAVNGKGVAEVQVVGAPHEVDDVSAGVATEAVETPRLRVDAQAWMLVVMERAEADEMRPTAS